MTQASQPLWIQDTDTVIANSQDAQWRYSDDPDYTGTNAFLHKERNHNHANGSLEAIVQNLVRAERISL